MESVPSASPTSKTPELLEPYEWDGGWRIETVCSQCQVTLFCDSEDKPNEMALKLMRFGVVCDPCDLEREAAYQRGIRKSGLDARFRASGLPPAMVGYDWRDMDRTGSRRSVVAAARAWTESSSGRMVICGPVGTGKTRLAATAAWERLQLGDVVWCSVPVLLQHQFADKGSPERKHAQQALAGTRPLVLDDLGKEKPGDWSRQVLFGAIDARIQAGTPILITSNFDPDELADRLGEAVGSRLREFHQFELPGRDRRESPSEPLT